MKCEYLNYLERVTRACGEGKIKPDNALQVITLIKFLYQEAQPTRCQLCQAMTSVDTITGLFKVNRKGACQNLRSG